MFLSTLNFFKDMRIINAKNPSVFKNGEAMTFLHLVQKEGEASTDESVVAMLTTFKSSLADFDEAAKMVSTKVRTQNLISIFNELEKKFGVLKRIFSSFASLENTEIGKAAVGLTEVMENAERFKSRSYFDTIAKISIAVESVKEKAPAKVLKALELDVIIKDMEQNITLFRELYAERNSYREQRKKMLARTRLAAEEAYEKLMSLFCVKAVFGDEVSQSIVNRINEAYIWLHKGSKSSNAEVQAVDEAVES